MGSRAGAAIVRAKEDDMRFGQRVIVERGSERLSGKPGAHREVRGVLIGACGWHRRVRLAEDDPLSTIPEWSKVGDVGVWSASAVRKAE